jgi:hypothetical protein
MTDSRYPISGNIRIWFVPDGGLALPAAPTAAEINAGLDISDAVSWNDKDFGVSASNTTNDPAITAKGNVSDRGAAQYGGGLSFYYPRPGTPGVYTEAEEALGKPGTRGYLIVRVDGSEDTTSAGDASHPGVNANAGDFVNVFKVETAGYAQAITGEEAFRYTVSFLTKGFVQTFAVVRASATPAAPEITTAPPTLVVGDLALLNATLIGRQYTRGLEYTSSDPTVATVSRGAVIKGLAAGTATITGTDPATGESDTLLVTVTAA